MCGGGVGGERIDGQEAHHTLSDEDVGEDHLGDIHPVAGEEERREGTHIQRNIRQDRHRKEGLAMIADQVDHSAHAIVLPIEAVQPVVHHLRSNIAFPGLVAEFRHESIQLAIAEGDRQAECHDDAHLGGARLEHVVGGEVHAEVGLEDHRPIQPAVGELVIDQREGTQQQYVQDC